jgi:hypothetical protein
MVADLSERKPGYRRVASMRTGPIEGRLEGHRMSAVETIRPGTILESFLNILSAMPSSPLIPKPHQVSRYITPEVAGLDVNIDRKRWLVGFNEFISRADTRERHVSARDYPSKKEYPNNLMVSPARIGGHRRHWRHLTMIV